MFGVLNLGPAASAFRRGFDVLFEVSPAWLRAEHPATTLGESLTRSGELGSVVRNLQRSGWTWADDTDPHAYARLEAPVDRRPSGDALTAAAGRGVRNHVGVAADHGFAPVRGETWLAPFRLSGDTIVLAGSGLTLLIDGHSSGRIGPAPWAAPGYQQWLTHLVPERAVSLFATRDPVAILDALLPHHEALADPDRARALLGR